MLKLTANGFLVGHFPAVPAVDPGITVTNLARFYSRKLDDEVTAVASEASTSLVCAQARVTCDLQ